LAADTFTSWVRRSQSAVPLLAISFGVVALIVVSADRHLDPNQATVTSYVGISRVAAAFGLAAGLGLLVVAAVAWLSPLTAQLGSVALIAAVAWFASDVEGWVRGGDLAHSLGAAGVPLATAALASLVFVALRGYVRSRLTAVAMFLVAVVCLAAVVRPLVRDPFFDPYCWRNCADDNVFLVRSAPGLARELDRIWLGASAALGVLLVITVTWSFRDASPVARRLHAPLLIAGGLVGATQAAYAATLLHRPFEDPTQDQFSWLFYARALAVAALALALLWSAAWIWRRRGAVARLARVLSEGPPPGGLRDALADAFDDPTLEVRYWLPATRRYVDGWGEPTDPPAPVDRRSVTQIVRQGSAVAAVLHDPALIDASFERELGSAARLTVENERLQAEVRAQLADLRRSRIRITERGDAERRRLERDLHDGAQQRLLALSYELRLARSAAESAGEELAASELAAAVDEAHAALEDLRRLAHGIYPAILADVGLRPALDTLADDAPVALDVSRVAEDRFGGGAEVAAYVAVREAVDDAVERGATAVSVEVARADASLRLAISDNGSARSSPLVHLADRIGALGGLVESGETFLRAEIPCG
jgi:signal transduction histidine kinase